MGIDPSETVIYICAVQHDLFDKYHRLKGGSMEIIILALVVVGLAVVAVWYYNRDSKSLDVNNDGQIDAQDAAQALKTTAQGISQDVRDTRDAALIAAAETAMKAAGVIETAKKTTKAKVSKVADKVTAAKKSVARKPRAKK